MTDLLNHSHLLLTPYETYVLLAATYLHDVGIVYGRKEHELKCHEVLATLGSRAGDDVIEKLIIVRIAQSHGGLTPTGEKDTIRNLDFRTRILGEHVRVQVLAALLRLSDELADERERANRFILEHNEKLLAGSEIYHAYSFALQSAIVEPPDIYLDFELLKKYADRTLAKEQGSVYLLEEIYKRTLKVQQETVYCMRFLRPLITVDRVRVKIDVFDNYDSNTFLVPREQIGYTLEEPTAYPDYSGKTIQELLPNHDLPSGEALKSKLWPETQQEAPNATH
ncbi:MAG TPA: hypothetical protein VGL38_08085 [bacterium]|jgi:hypothetical protein